MEQLSIFSNEPKTERSIGFIHRKRLYDVKGDYQHTAIPTEEGYNLIPISLALKSRDIIKLTDKEYRDYVTVHKLKEVIPKVKKVKGMK